MPKVPVYTLAWSPVTAAYELYQTRDREALRIVPDSPEWFAWLDQVSSFAFSGKRGHYTARKETKQRGDRYWSAYLATGEQLTKRYLGKTADLTLARLEHIAGILIPTINRGTTRETQLPPPLSPATDADGEGGAARQPLLPQWFDPLTSLLATKLHIPRPRPHLVLRSHLVEQLQRGMERALTLVSAPAGFGKTTLLAQWLAESGTPAAWVSLGPEDNDPTSFLSYMIAALQPLNAQLGTTALALLRTPQPPPPETVLAVLTNDLAGREVGDFALVLDDYHVITDEPIQRGMTFLLEHLPPQLHLILAARADPPLPLARLRAQGQLCEVRTGDLRFEAAEVNTFLQAVMGLDLPSEAITLLERRTEGWIAGLQLAALSLQGRADVSAFLAAFSGSHRFVLDYLSEEVLSRQSTPVQQFLSREAFAALDVMIHLAWLRRFVPHLVTQGAAVRAQLELAQGDLAAAIRCIETSGLSVDDENLSYLREGEYLALARVRIAQGRDDPAAPFLQDALHLLERLLREAEAKARIGSVLQILVLCALAHQAQGDRTAALSTLEQALLLAAPEGYWKRLPGATMARLTLGLRLLPRCMATCVVSRQC